MGVGAHLTVDGYLSEAVVGMNEQLITQVVVPSLHGAKENKVASSRTHVTLQAMQQASCMQFWYQ